MTDRIWKSFGRVAHRTRAGAGLASAVVVMAGCAGSTFGSGVGDALLERPPYYAGRLDDGAGRVGRLPITYQRGAQQEPMFDPADRTGDPIARLLADMNAYLDSLGLGTLVELHAPAGARPPDVQFGCLMDATGDCEEGGRSRMRLAVARPNTAWTAWADVAIDSTAVDHLLLLTLEVSQYWPRQRNLLGAKEVELGSNHVIGLPWLTSLDDPVSVLQLTGALIGRNGRARRIGAEGLLARRTPFLASAVGAQRLITDEDVEQVRTSRRDDLPGRPLVWQAALRDLVRGLMGGAFQ